MAIAPTYPTLPQVRGSHLHENEGSFPNRRLLTLDSYHGAYYVAKFSQYMIE